MENQPRKAKVIKNFEVQLVDESGENDVVSESEQTKADILRLENRFRQSTGQETNTTRLLFDLLRNFNERISRFENKI